MISLQCPCCASALQLADHFADSVIRCPECEERLRVPGSGVAPTPARSTPPRASRTRELIAAAAVIVFAAMPVAGVAALLGRANTFASGQPLIDSNVPPSADAPSLKSMPAEADDATAVEPVAPDQPAAAFGVDPLR